jgi:hypothetical protein
MATGFLSPIGVEAQFFSNSGAVLNAGKIATYLAGTTTPTATYTTSSLATANANPIILTSAGRLPSGVWQTGGVPIKVVISDSSNNVLMTIDNISGIGDPATLYPQTAAEVTAGITPTNTSYPVSNVMRYGADPTGAATSDTAFSNAEAVAYAGGAGKIYAPAGIYSVNGTLTLRSGVALIGDGSGGSEYYPGSPWNTVPVTQIWKKTTGSAGPLFIVQTADQIKGLYLRYDLVGGSSTGVIQIGTTSTYSAATNSVYNAELEEISLYGPAINSFTFTGTPPMAGATSGTLSAAWAMPTGAYPVAFSDGESRDVNFAQGATSATWTGGLTNSVTSNFSVIDGNSCAIYFYDGTVNQATPYHPVQVYYNRCTSVRIQNFFRGVHLGDNCNGNAFVGIVMRQVYLHWDLNGTTTDLTCVENAVVGAEHSNVGPLPSVAITFTASPTGVSGTLTSNWGLATGVYPSLFSDGELRMVTLTNGATTATWAVALTGAPTATATAAVCVVFSLQNGSVNNSFAGYATECNGTAFYIDASSSAGNTFLGYENESQSLSFVPSGCFHALWAQPVNRSQYSSILLPSVAVAPQGFYNGQGNAMQFFQMVTGTLPNLNSSLATLVASDSSSKSIVQFPASQYTKLLMPNFRCKLTVYLAAPGGGVGESIALVEFLYLLTNITNKAGQLSVLSVSNKGPYIKGLYFISGKTGGTGMRVAIVCGLLGAVTAPHLAVKIDMEVLTYTTNVVPMAQFAQLAFVSTACTANDVTDAISLLTVADTAV